MADLPLKYLIREPMNGKSAIFLDKQVDDPLMSAIPAQNTKQLCTFRVGPMDFGVDLTLVQEVIRFQEITPVPMAPSVVQGLINLRGQIVTALDMRVRLGLPLRADAEKPTNVVVRLVDGIVSLLVDEIGDVIEVDSTSFEVPPSTLSAASRALIDGVYKLNSTLLLLLNTQRAVRL